ncbi:MAG: hypothetical protein MSA69_04305 [Prevotella sp.]|nr:hypothetical protein [Prevotella sp.]
MKREYRKPTIEVVDIETKATCVVASWHVDGSGRPSTDQGYIIEDQGQGEYGEGEYDPWNSDNW